MGGGTAIDKNFRNSVVVITGGASGIGRSLAFAFAREGARLVIADMEQAPADEVAAELNAAGTEAIAIRCDIIEAEDVERLAAETKKAFGGANVLCNIAGVARIAKLHETSAADVEWLFSVNVLGMCHCIRCFVPQLKSAAKRGEPAHIVNASSGFGVAVPSMGPISPSGYAGTKHAVVGISDAMRNDLKDDGIGVSVVCPGVVNTQTWTSMRFRQQQFGGPVAGTPESKAIVEAHGQDPDECAEMIIERLKSGDFYILPLNEQSKKAMQWSIDERYRELQEALKR